MIYSSTVRNIIKYIKIYFLKYIWSYIWHETKAHINFWGYFSLPYIIKKEFLHTQQSTGKTKDAIDIVYICVSI